MKQRSNIAIRCACSLIILSLVSGCGSKIQTPAPHRTTLKVLFLAGQIKVLSATFQRALSAQLPDVDVQFSEMFNSLDSLKALQSGEADLTFVLADLAYLAFIGEIDGNRYDRLRGVAILDPSPIFLAVRRNSSIHTLEDLRNGRLNLGLPRNSPALTGESLLNAVGIKATLSYELPGVAAPQLANGTLNASLLPGIFPLNRALIHDTRILSLSPDTVRRVHRAYPFIRGVVVPANVLGVPILTIAVDRVLVCRSGLDERLVFAVAKSLFGGMIDLSLINAPLRQMNVEDAPATPIPLHEGAARYYRTEAAMEDR
jgi:TRAP transporter TAXI family solute receptor